MHTKDKLAAALREVGLDDMADKAATGYYHDFLSPLDFPEMQLVADLAEAANYTGEARAAGKPLNEAIFKLRERVINGDFDASTEESEKWFNSAEGRDAMNRLVTGR